MVLADGSFVTASADENPDLFWAVRGGGGNFGVVTSFLFQAAPGQHGLRRPDALADWSRRRSVLRWYRDFIRSAPDELNGFFAFLTRAARRRPSRRHLHDKKMCGDRLVLHGPAGAGRGDLRADPRSSARRRSTWSARSRIRRCRACSTRSTRRACSGTGRRTSSTSCSDEAIALHVEYGAQLPTMHSTMHLYPIDGAAGRVGKQRHAVGLPRRQVGAGDRRASTPTRPTTAHDRAGRRSYWDGAAPVLGGRRLRQHDDGRGRGSRSGRPTATTTTGWRRSRRSTTRTTSSASTRTYRQYPICWIVTSAGNSMPSLRIWKH